MSDEFLFGHMVHEYYVSRLRAIAAKRADERARIRTPDQVRRLRDEVRRKLRACFGPLPQRTPLNARVTGQLASRCGRNPPTASPSGSPNCQIESLIAV